MAHAQGQWPIHSPEGRHASTTEAAAGWKLGPRPRDAPPYVLTSHLLWSGASSSWRRVACAWSGRGRGAKHGQGRCDRVHSRAEAGEGAGVDAGAGGGASAGAGAGAVSGAGRARIMRRGGAKECVPNPGVCAPLYRTLKPYHHMQHTGKRCLFKS